MQITDPIADLLTRIRNASTAKHPSVEIPASNMKKAICRYRWSAPRVQAGPAHLHQLRGYAEGHEGPGHRNHFHL